MVWGVTFRAAGTLALGALLIAIFGDVLLEILSYAGHEDHWFIQGIVLVEQIAPIILVLSVGVMLLANVLSRRVQTVR